MSRPAKLNKTYIAEETLTHSSMNAITSKIDETIDYIEDGTLTIRQNGSVVSNSFTANSSSGATVDLVDSGNMFVKGETVADNTRNLEEIAEQRREDGIRSGAIKLKWWDGDKVERSFNVYNVKATINPCTINYPSTSSYVAVNPSLVDLEFMITLGDADPSSGVDIGSDLKVYKDADGEYAIQPVAYYFLRGTNKNNKLKDMMLNYNYGFNQVEMRICADSITVEGKENFKIRGNLYFKMHLYVDVNKSNLHSYCKSLVEDFGGYLCLRRKP